MKVYSIGSLNIDYVYKVPHFVRAGETLASTEMNIFPGGKGLNQSIALKKAGLEVIHVAPIGEDGEFLLEVLKEAGVNTEKIVKTSGKSGHAIIEVDESGQNSILLFRGTNFMFTREYIEEALKTAEKGDALVLQNEINALDDIFEIAAEKGLSIAFNPSPFNEKIYSLPLTKVKWLFVNEVEGEELFGSSDPKTIADRFLEKYPESVLILTLGKNGCLYADKKERLTQKIFKVPVVDTTAAGDTFSGYFLSSVLSGKEPKEALKIASAASAIAVSRAGASVSIPLYNEVEKFLEKKD
jgi:ribokinase